MIVTTTNHYTFSVPEAISAPELRESWTPRTTPGFWGPLDLRDLDGRDYVLLSPFSYTSRAGETTHCPVGFRTDLSSIPRAFWRILPPHGTYDKMGVIHDQVFQRGRIGERICTRAEADELALEMCEELGVPWLQRQMIYRGLQTGSWIAWNNYRRKENVNEESNDLGFV